MYLNASWVLVLPPERLNDNPFINSCIVLYLSNLNITLALSLYVTIPTLVRPNCIGSPAITLVVKLTITWYTKSTLPERSRTKVTSSCLLQPGKYQKNNMKISVFTNWPEISSQTLHNLVSTDTCF